MSTTSAANGTRTSSRRLPWLVGLLSIVACVSCAEPAVADPFRWSAPKRIDTATVPARSDDFNPAINVLSCPSTDLCVGAGSDGSIVTSTAPASPGSWRTALVHGARAILDVSCPSTSLCLAAADDAVFASTDPAGGAAAWRKVATPLHRGFGVSCPTVSLCALVGYTNVIATSTDPASATPTWTVRALSPSYLRLDVVSCTSASLCVASASGVASFRSTNPTGGASSWSDTQAPAPEVPARPSCNTAFACQVTQDSVERARAADGHDSLSGISCTSSGLCIAGDTYGNLLARAGGAQAWTRTVGVAASGFQAVACPSDSLCLAADDAGRIATSTTPAAAHPSWSFTRPLIGRGPTRRAALVGISCGSTRLCVAIDSAGNVLSTARPTGPASSWQATPIDPGLILNDVSCTAHGLCVAVAANSYLATSTRPIGPAVAWRLTGLDLFDEHETGPEEVSLTDVSCASSLLCVTTPFVAGSDTLEVSVNPTVPTPIWNARTAGRPNDENFFQAISCPSRALCVAAAGQGGTVATSTDAGRRWKLTYVEAPGAENGSGMPSVTAISCPAASFCVAADDSGQVIATRHPAGGRKAWHRSRLPRGHKLTVVSCATTSLCAGIDQHGRVLLSTRPAGPGSMWKVAPVKQQASHLSCPTARLCVLTTSGGDVIVGQR